MIRKIGTLYLNSNNANLNFKYLNCLHVKYSTESTDQNNNKSIENNKHDDKNLETVKKPIFTRLIYPEERKSHKEKNEKEERKGPFKNYFESEERDKKQIMFHEEYFETTARKKDLNNFMAAVEAFKIANPTKKLYIDFIYGALLKMKEFDAHTNLEAYRKLMEIFPVGPLRCSTKWQMDNMHFPRQQNCAIQILEQMERNGVMLDEDFVRLCVKIFDDWTHVVRKAKRQLYWLPKFKHLNPYPVPSVEKIEGMKDIELAFAALERMTRWVDIQTKYFINHTDQLNESNEKEKDKNTNNESTWIITAQSPKQQELLLNHKKQIPIFVDGPYNCWIRSKRIEYFMMRTDTLEDTVEKLKQIENADLDDVKNLPNMFSDPFSKNVNVSKIPELSPYELPEGNAYAICCTGTGTKSSVYAWTKFLELNNQCLKNYLIVFRNKEKPNDLVDLNKIKTNSS